MHAEGLNNAPGFCGSVENVGGLAVGADPGIFNGSLSLQFYVYALEGPTVPDIVLKIASDMVRHADDRRLAATHLGCFMSREQHQSLFWKCLANVGQHIAAGCATTRCPHVTWCVLVICCMGLTSLFANIPAAALEPA